MRYTLKDDTFVNIKESGCNLNYVPKDSINIHVTEDNIDFVEGFINKLGQLEDIEDELGVDLITLFKYLKAYYCFTKEHGNCYVIGVSKDGVILMPKAFPYGECEFTEDFKNYGKTWSLTKEELEKGEQYDI